MQIHGLIFFKAFILFEYIIIVLMQSIWFLRRFFVHLSTKVVLRLFQRIIGNILIGVLNCLVDNYKAHVEHLLKYSMKKYHAWNRLKVLKSSNFVNLGILRSMTSLPDSAPVLLALLISIEKYYLIFTKFNWNILRVIYDRFNFMQQSRVFIKLGKK